MQKRKECRNEREVRMWADAKLKEFEIRGNIGSDSYNRFIAKNAKYIEGFLMNGKFYKFKLK